MSQVARLGDRSSHGGTIISASTDVLANGIGVARNGDLHFCPIHGVQPLLSQRLEVANGQPIVCVGDRAQCTAVITTGSPNVNAG